MLVLERIKSSLVLLTILGVLIPSGFTNSTTSEDKIIIKLNSRQICSGRMNECFPMAPGPNSPVGGPYYVLDHAKEGFNWINPFTGQYYKKGTHPLGDIWINVVSKEGLDYGIHETPDKKTPLHLQSSAGCFRMYGNHIKRLSPNVEFLDKIYVLKDE